MRSVIYVENDEPHYACTKCDSTYPIFYDKFCSTIKKLVESYDGLGRIIAEKYQNCPDCLAKKIYEEHNDKKDDNIYIIDFYGGPLFGRGFTVETDKNGYIKKIDTVYIS